MSRNPLVSSPSGGGGNHHHNSRPGSGSSSRSSSPSPSLYNVPSSTGGGGGRRRRRGTRRVVSTLRRIERGICTLAKLFPLSIVYGGQTWAAYTEGWSISFTHMKGFKGAFLGTLGFVIYGLAVWSYTTAVFRDPGSPLTNKHSYSHLPTTEPSASFPSGPITVKSSGTPRFCKKCQCRKPDRAHHCSTCNRCVLRMDHHCPWLATCLGLRNYKPFLLFLIYTSLLCILSFLVSTGYVYATIFNSDDLRGGFGEGSEITPVNWILLATISGIIGLVLSGFTIWHVLLASSGMTTIESLEKVRYSNPAIFHGQQGGHGGISDWSDAAERSRAQATYQAYLDDEALAKLPHAFDLGRRQNLRDIFGTRRWAWFLPLPMTREEERRLDGWRWETSPVWREGVERVRRGREERIAQLG
ncbi:DHHC palmitoyltransferase-domain-containing protein, partial [Peziza echinospora]